MDYFENGKLEEKLANRKYDGRGIFIGKSKDGENAVFGYFIMGRSANSRNRLFVESGSDLEIRLRDADAAEDTSLIMYVPVRKLENNYIVTNGDQTDTICEHMLAGKSFEDALFTRAFEPDAPNFTPRISGLLSLSEGAFKYRLSILKSADEKGSECSRYFFNYAALPGVGHYIHTYAENVNPLQSFFGEPERIEIPNDMDKFAKDVWESLDADNKIAFHLRYINLKTREEKKITLNK